MRERNKKNLIYNFIQSHSLILFLFILLSLLQINIRKANKLKNISIK